jgi:hypothetical protein
MRILPPPNGGYAAYGLMARMRKRGRDSMSYSDVVQVVTADGAMPF